MNVVPNQYTTTGSSIARIGTTIFPPDFDSLYTAIPPKTSVIIQNRPASAIKEGRKIAAAIIIHSIERMEKRSEFFVVFSITLFWLEFI